MKADESAARLDVMLECVALHIVAEGFIVAVRKYERGILAQVRVREDVLGSSEALNGESSLCAHLADRGHAVGDIVVYVSFAVWRVAAGMNQNACGWGVF